MVKLLWVCLGSALGGGLRYLVAQGALKLLGASFPYGTLAVNLVGSSLLAGLMFVGTETTTLSPTARLALTTGVMGGFTTYSTFSFETLSYLQEGAWRPALGYIVATVVGCLVAAWLGWVVAKRLTGM